jgi:tetratricopeptide (TPR) repeat protein
MRFLQGSSGFFKGFLDTPTWVGLVLSPVLAGVLVPPALSLTWAGEGVEWRRQLVAQTPAHPEATRANAGQLMQEAEELFNQQTVETRQQALAKFEQARQLYKTIGDRAGEGQSLNNIGFTYFSQGQYGAALGYYQQALAIRQAMGDRAGEGNSLNNIGSIYSSQGQYGAALSYYQQSLAIRQEIGDRAGEGNSLNNIGAIYDSQGQYGEALGYYQQSLAIRQEIGDRAVEGSSLNNIGGIYNSQGQYGEALGY